MPDDFTIEITEADLFGLGVYGVQQVESEWIETRRELIKRGYTVFEWTDDARMVRCARCFKPNQAKAHQQEPRT